MKRPLHIQAAAFSRRQWLIQFWSAIDPKEAARISVRGINRRDLRSMCRVSGVISFSLSIRGAAG